MAKQMDYVRAAEGEKIVETKNFIAALNRTVAQMRSEKTCAARD